MLTRKKAVVALAGAALTALALTACSGGGSGGSPTDHGKLSLLVEDYYTQPQAAALDKVYQSCASQIGVTVTSSHVAGAGLIAKVLQQASSRTMPDVLMLDNPDVQQIAATGALSPLKDYGITGAGFAPGVVSAGTYKGTLYGLAPAVNTIGLIYNVDLLKAAGLTPPKTWAQLETDAQKLTKPGVYGFAFSGINTFEGTWQFLPFMWSNGGNEKNIDTPQTTQALQFLTDLVNKGYASKSVVTWTQADVENQFAAGKAAMMINGPWQFPSLQSTKGLKWASVPIPTRTTSQTLQAPLGGETFNVPNTGDKAKMQAAGKLVACITSAKNQVIISQTEGDVPASVSVAASFAKSNPLYASFVAAVKTARSRTAELGADWPTAATKIYTAEQLALTGKESPAKALAQAQSQSQ